MPRNMQPVSATSPAYSTMGSARKRRAAAAPKASDRVKSTPALDQGARRAAAAAAAGDVGAGTSRAAAAAKSSAAAKRAPAVLAQSSFHAKGEQPMPLNDAIVDTFGAIAACRCWCSGGKGLMGCWWGWFAKGVSPRVCACLAH